MRKLVALELLSLDGVMDKPEEWAFNYSDEEMNEANASGMAASDTMLLGRVTYEGLAAFWPHQPAGTPMVDYINSVPKFVVSGTLEGPLEWNNSTLIEGNPAEEISELKQQPGKDITIIGSGVLVRSLLNVGLLDELWLMVHPLVLGKGKRLFEDWGDPKSLTLVDSKRSAPVFSPSLTSPMGDGPGDAYLDDEKIEVLDAEQSRDRNETWKGAWCRTGRKKLTDP